MNSLQLCGRVIEKTPSETSQGNVKFSKIRIAIDKNSKDDDDSYDVFEVVVFRNLADMELRVGQYIEVSGKLSSNNYEKDGITRYNCSIFGNSVSILG